MTEIQEQIVKQFGGTLNRKMDSAYVVMYWADSMLMHEAQLTEGFFVSKEQAEAFQKKHDNFHQRATLHDLSKDRCSRIYPIRNEDENVEDGFPAYDGDEVDE